MTAIDQEGIRSGLSYRVLSLDLSRGYLTLVMAFSMIASGIDSADASQWPLINAFQYLSPWHDSEGERRRQGKELEMLLQNAYAPMTDSNVRRTYEQMIRLSQAMPRQQGNEFLRTQIQHHNKWGPFAPEMHPQAKYLRDIGNFTPEQLEAAQDAQATLNPSRPKNIFDLSLTNPDLAAEMRKDEEERKIREGAREQERALEQIKIRQKAIAENRAPPKVEMPEMSMEEKALRQDSIDARNEIRKEQTFLKAASSVSQLKNLLAHPLFESVYGKSSNLQVELAGAVSGSPEATVMGLIKSISAGRGFTATKEVTTGGLSDPEREALVLSKTTLGDLRQTKKSARKEARRLERGPRNSDSMLSWTQT